MSALTVVYTALFYAASAILAIGVIAGIGRYLRTPAPLKIPTTPAPTTGTGVALRMTREVVFFESLFRSSKWTWLFGSQMARRANEWRYSADRDRIEDVQQISNIRPHFVSQEMAPAPTRYSTAQVWSSIESRYRSSAIAQKFSDTA